MILTLKSVSLHLGPRVLLDQVDWQLDVGTRVAVVGRNGAGKSTLMSLLSGTQRPDSGDLWMQPGTRVALLDQQLPEGNGDESVYHWVAAALADVGELISEYHSLIAQGDQVDLVQLERLTQALENANAWTLEQRINTVLTQLQLPADKPLNALSGGWRRRAALARVLIVEPDLLLLDEPTNHLDLPAIEWLEEYLSAYRGALVLISHDRAFLRRLANEYLELDRGALYRYRGDYDSFLAQREQRWEEEERNWVREDKHLAQEETWLRQGVKARRRRNQGRLRALLQARQERTQRVTRQGNARFQWQEAEVGAKLVAEFRSVVIGYDDKPLLEPIDLPLIRGEKIGVIGANGAGKSSLLRVLLGEQAPLSGDVQLGPGLQVAYFDQQRQQLNDDDTLVDAVAEGRESISINGENRSIYGYLEDFLFEPGNLQQKVGRLSGGERNRLLLARLFSQPANVLVLDEPTNDLDADTLDLLEERLADFPGTLILVSHDRDFLDRVVTQTWVLPGNGRLECYVGGYQDWIAQGGRLIKPETEAKATVAKPAAKPVSDKPAPKKSVKLSYKLQRELEQLPQLIDVAEQRIEALTEQTQDPAFYNGDHQQMSATLDALTAAQGDLEALYERWEALEAMAAGE